MKDFPQSAQLLPDGRTLFLTVFRANAPFSEPAIIARSIRSGEERLVLRGGLQARYIPTGHLVYFDDATLLAVAFDVQTLSLRGSPVPVAENVATSGVPGHPIHVAHVAISPAGTLADMSGSAIEASRRAMVWLIA